MKKIAAIVISYNPNIITINKLLKSLYNQVDNIYLVDNGSADKNFVNEKLSDKLQICFLDTNLGIAAAQNIGIKLGLADSASHFVFFDQDSQISDDMIILLDNYFDKLRLMYKIAAVGPVFYDITHNYIYPQIKLNKYFGRERIIPKNGDCHLEVSFIISSGTFTTREVLNDVGLMDENFFIDYVDTEWCLRASSKKYKFFAIPSIKMAHCIGDTKIKFLRWNLPVHSPWRRYFRMRNMYMLFKLSYVPTSLKLREFVINNLHQAMVIFSQHNKKDYFRFWFKSQVDGIAILLSSNK